MPPAPVAPPLGSQPPTKTNRWPLAVALVCILAAVVAVYLTHPRTSERTSILRVMSGTFENRTLQEITNEGMTAVSLPVAGKVVEYARAGVEAAIVLEDNGGQAVYVLRSEPLLVADSMAPKTALVVSEDGTYLGYAEREDDPSATTTAAFYDTDAWVVHVYGVESGERQVLGVGYAPQFFTLGSEQYVSYTTPFGMRFVNLVTKQSTDLSVQFPPTDGRAITSISPDGKYVALPNVTASRYSLFELRYADDTFSIAPKGDLLANTSAVAFAKGKVYGASRNDTETFFYVADPADLTNARDIARMPADTVYALIP